MVISEHTDGVKDDRSKLPLDLFPWECLELLLEEEGNAVVPSPVHLAAFVGGGRVEELVWAFTEVGNVWENIEAAAKVLDFGARKYEPHNWRKGLKWSRLIAAAYRHWAAAAQGEPFDEESGLPHISHYLCCLAFLLASALSGHGTDDRYHVNQS